MRLKLISVGRQQADPFSPLVEDYSKRISKFLPIDTLVLKPGKGEKIAGRMLKEAKNSQVLVAMDELGKEVDSKGFARLVSSWMNRGISEVTIVVGGADGLQEQVKKQADLQLSLSKMTLPHRLARLILIEQIYRALCIIRNVPYQK